MLGLVAGLYMLFAKNYLDIWSHPELVSTNTHIILSGSVMMMIMGVALRNFPLPEKDDSLYKLEFFPVSYYIITISTSTRFVSQALSPFILPDEILKFISFISAVGQIAGLIIFFISM